MSEPPSNEPPGQDPSADNPRPLPPSYNAPRTTPPPYKPPRPLPPSWPFESEDDPEPVGKRTTNGFAIASMGLGLAAMFPLSVIFGIIALSQIDKRRQSGRGLAIAGLVFSGIWVSIIATVSIVGSNNDRDEADTVAAEGSVSTTSLQVGDCLNELDSSPAVYSLPAVPCSQPHEGEVFGLFDLPEGDYPGEETVFRLADARCSELLRAYSIEAFDDLTVGLAHVYPTRGSWSSSRQVVCLAVSLDGLVSGSYAEG